MPTIVHEFAWPDRVVVGTVGRPGERTFFLQVRAGSRIASVALEKEQSALLAEKMDEILDELATNDENGLTIPATTPVELVDNEPLEPVEQDFRTGALSLGWDPTTAQIVIEAFAFAESESEGDEPDSETEVIEPTEMLMVRMPVGTARAFAKRTREIVGAGRPICPVCGTPIDESGHTHTQPDDL